MKFAFVADIPDWALHRQGLGLVKYGTVDDHRWFLHHCRPCDFDVAKLYQYDAVRIGSAGLLYYMHTNGLLPLKTHGPGPKIIVSFASFRDEPDYREVIEMRLADVDGFCTVDHRLVGQAAAYRRAAVHVPDRTDPDTFRPMVELRPQDGPLRVGWAGSVAFWPGIKHPDAIEEACRQVEGVQFVRQDREKDGQKSAGEMAQWFNGLDVYCAANDIDTPTPVPWIEAAACGVPVVGTRCGELWQLVHGIAPGAIIKDSSVAAIAEALQRAVKDGRQRLHRRGLTFQRRFRYFLYWGEGAAQDFTRFVADVCERPGARPPQENQP